MKMYIFTSLQSRSMFLNVKGDVFFMFEDVVQLFSTVSSCPFSVLLFLFSVKHP